MDGERILVPSEKIQAFKGAQARERHIALPVLKCAREVYERRIKACALALMYRNGPRKAERDLGELRAYLAVLFHHPLQGRDRDISAVARLYDRVARAVLKLGNRTKRSVRVACERVVLGAHHDGTHLELKTLGRKASALKRFYERCRTARVHKVCLGRSAYGCKLLRIDAIDVRVVRIEARYVSGVFRLHFARANARHIGVVERPFPDIRENRAELHIVLAMLFFKIQRNGVQGFPGWRLERKR